MADPVAFKFSVQTPEGIQHVPAIGTADDSPADVKQKLEAKGYTVVDFHGVKAIPPAPERKAQPAAPQTQRAPGLGTDLASMASQIAGGAAGGAGAGLLGAGPLGMALGGLGGGLAGGIAPYMAQRRGMPTAGDVAGVALGEVPFGRMIPGMIRRPVTEALGASGRMLSTAREAIGPIMRRPTAIAGEILNTAKGIARGAEPMMKKALGETTKSFGVDLGKMTDRQLLDLVRESPERAASAFAAFEKASGRRLATPETIQRLWVSDVLHSGAKNVARGAQKAKGLLVEPGGNYVLDGKVFTDAWKGLTAEGKATFGKEGQRAFDGLTAALENLQRAPKGIARLTGQRVPMTSFLAGIMRVLKAHPAGAGAMAGLGMMEAGTMLHQVGAHPVAAGLAVAGLGLGRLGKRAANKLFDRVLATPAGVEWLTQGVNMTGKGMPSVMIADALSRALMRSPQLLADLGLQPPPQQPQQAAQ